MNSSNGSGIDSALLAAPFQLNIWLGTFLWATGNVGCLGNFIGIQFSYVSKTGLFDLLILCCTFGFNLFQFCAGDKNSAEGLPNTNRYCLPQYL